VRNRSTQSELLQPAVDGTLNVLRAAKHCGVSRVVLVSSQTAMVPNPDWPADKVIDGDSWANVEILKKLEVRHSQDLQFRYYSVLVLETSTAC
jgi:nucleoside-diphosphate-sugar epimerase